VTHSREKHVFWFGFSRIYRFYGNIQFPLHVFHHDGGNI
jgi:hypothetical protein